MAKKEEVMTYMAVISEDDGTCSRKFREEREKDLRLEDIKPPKRVIIRGLSPEERQKLRRKQNRESARRTRQRYRLQKRSTEKNYKEVVDRIQELQEEIRKLKSPERVSGVSDDDEMSSGNSGKRTGGNMGMKDSKNRSSVIAVQNLINHQASDMSSSDNSTGQEAKRKCRTNARGLSPEQRLELRRQQNRESARRLRERARIRKEALEKEHHENVARVRHLEQVLHKLTQRKEQR